MQWTKPDYKEISLGMEVTGYVNTDDDGFLGQIVKLPAASTEATQQSAPPQAEKPA